MTAIKAALEIVLKAILGPPKILVRSHRRHPRGRSLGYPPDILKSYPTRALRMGAFGQRETPRGYGHFSSENVQENVIRRWFDHDSDHNVLKVHRTHSIMGLSLTSKES